MKALRKSLNSGSNKDNGFAHISTPIPTPLLSKPTTFTPPNKVIRAISQYRSQAPQQLSFQKGDFFHVIREVEEQGSWYEAHNPLSGSRGLVPRALFEEFHKGNMVARVSTIGSPKLNLSPASASPPKAQVFYAIVLHDFVAERPDELDAKAGDPISVVAQSNREWFVAKPIGKLGRPGLIPVSFVEVRDPATSQPIHDIEALMDQGALPRVEEWKRQMLNYKATSISLGVLDEPSIKNGVMDSPYMPKTTSESLALTQTLNDAPILPEGILLSGEVVSFHLEMDEYWFRVHSVFQPFNSDGQSELPPAKQHVLYRCYNDFYDFQIDLLKSFPDEAGRETPQGPSPRLIPYMPGPVQHVDDAITLTRREELDKYLRNLCKLKDTTARYILESAVVRQFLAIKPGDAEVEVEPFYDEINALYSSRDAPHDYGEPSTVDEEAGLSDQMERLKVSPQHSGNDASDYGEDRDSRYRGQSFYDYDNQDEYYSQESQPVRPHPYAAQNHQRGESVSSFHRTSTNHSSRSASPAPQRTKSPLSPQQTHPYAWNGHSFDDYYDPNEHASVMTPTTPSTRSSQPSIANSSKSRSRSHSNATNLNTPPISESNPQTAFVKIKIFDSVTEDLIAIRVHPRVTHSQLMQKVQMRLGENVVSLRYRDSMDGYVDLQNDDELRSWIETADKHVLYAD